MNILNKMSNVFRIDVSNAKSTVSEINELVQYSNIVIPSEFLEIIGEKTELEICVNDEKYIRIWGAKGCIDMNDAYNIQKYIPNSLAIGDDECSNVVLYAYGKKGFGIYVVSFSDLDADELVYIADSLEAFFVYEKGVNIFNNIW